MREYAQVIIDISRRGLDRLFTYRIPASMRDALRAGSIVVVPFGAGNTLRRGYVAGFSDEADLPREKIKEIAEIVEPARGYSMEDNSEFYLQLAAWMKNRYGATMAAAMRTVLASRKGGKIREKRLIRLLLSPEEARGQLELFEQKHQTARARLLRELLEAPQLPWTLVTSRLHVSSSAIGAMKRAGILAVDNVQELRNPVNVSPSSRTGMELSPEQRRIVDTVVADFDRLRPRTVSVSLLHGVTGSGKTEVYIHIIREICARGRQAIMLIPEISLSFQTLMRFYSHFGDRVSVVNSMMSDAERADQWERARRGEIDVIIGPRSALFTPFSRLGVIVIDEEHEHSYKNESMPKYQTRDVAEEIARMHGAVLVLGSATPSLESYWRARQGEIRLFRLRERLTGGTLPQVETVDMRRELQSGNRSILSGSLYKKIEDRLRKGEQSMLFINRRGFAGFVSCRNCGFVPRCPHCDVALSLHTARDGGRLVCHYCGYSRAAFRTCPECGSRYVTAMRAGTEKIEGMLRETFPQARILRMDADTTRRKDSYEKILSAFASEEADILLGTQMIVKGHDFPGVTLVGILMADLSLYGEDYRAAERTFQLLTQAAGRAGRGTRAGDVVIQTYQPEHYAIRHAAMQDYEGFYEEEIAYRKLMRYPPAAHMMAVQIQSEDEDAALRAAGEIRRELAGVSAVPDEMTPAPEPGFMIIGPAGGSFKKLRDMFRFVLYIKSEKYDTLIRCKDCVERMETAQAGRKEMLQVFRQVDIQFDFDPVNPF
ncbi:MAG: primosomal protein N' [Eubacteriales bacterium]|nr:primosomal protein N' [Eubacteriales bacterium]